MLDLKKRLHQSKAQRKLTPGTYTSKVVEVRWAANYAPEEAYEIIYDVTADGKVYQYREIFFTNRRNIRTSNFEDYLANNDIAYLDDFVGKTEELTFENVEASNGNTYLNITNRVFIK